MPDRGGEIEFLRAGFGVLDPEWLHELIEYLLCDRRGVLGVRHVLQDDELIAPRRAAVSPVRTQLLRRCATALSNWSPMLWPKLSLTNLKRSRSRNSTATARRWRAARVSAWPKRSSSRTRLGNPVSASWLARCARRLHLLARADVHHDAAQPLRPALLIAHHADNVVARPRVRPRPRPGTPTHGCCFCAVAARQEAMVCSRSSDESGWPRSRAR